VLSTTIQFDAEQWTARAGEYASRVERFVAPHAITRLSVDSMRTLLTWSYAGNEC
jgi:hypothetical protein